MKRHSLRDAGFTLVELLVVLAVVAVLIGVSLASLGSAIRYAQRAKCLAHLHTIGLTIRAFATDNDQQYPQTGIVVAFGATDSSTGKPGWEEQLDPYDGANHQIFLCPSAPSVAPGDYFLSSWCAYYANNQQYPTPAVNILHVKNQAEMIMAGDCTFGINAADADPDDAGPSNLPFNFPPWHGKFYNMLFVDGHAESVTGFDNTSMTNRYEGVGYSYNSASPTPP